MAGAVNSFAGGGAFITLPLLISLGVPPTIANMTSCTATWPGLAISTWGLRRSLHTSRSHLLKLSLVVGFWALIGSYLITISSNELFSKLVPFLMLGATAFFIYGTWFLKPPSHPLSNPVSTACLMSLAALGLYGGYWGGGMGIMILSILTLCGWKEIHEINAVKILLMTVINCVGLPFFIGGGFVSWPHAGVVCMGATLGGHLGARRIRTLSPERVKILIALYAVGISIYYFLTKAI